MTSQITIDPERKIGQIDPKIFGGFLEHMGRAIYEGIYDPASPLAGKDGMRTDVFKALQELGPTIIRYPGGNFLSGYHWMDGVGPKENRPRRRELAWHSIETNQFGTDEFIPYCRSLGAEPMLGANLGTGTIEEAGAMVEYVNAPVGSFYADLRARNGRTEPYGVKTWCLGNEMDGPWQIGHLEADEYGRKAREAAKLMKWQDPSIHLVACGSSGSGMPTYPEWDRVVLEHTWEHVDYLSLHYYAANRENDTASYLGMAKQFEDHIDSLAATIRYVKALKRSKHDVYLSWDEWNVWYKNMEMEGGWQEAPHLIEEVYNLEDALVVAQWLGVFLRRCSVLRMACLAQLVNVIAPILTRKDALLKQSTFYPFELFRRYACGDALDILSKTPVYEAREMGDVPLLDVSASCDEAGGRGALFVTNRSLKEPERLQVRWVGPQPAQEVRVRQLAGTDPKAANTFEHPDTIVPKDLGSFPVVDGLLEMDLAPLSFTVFTF